jgi:glycosyltransferase involved in cell wall biosynthesis
VYSPFLWRHHATGWYTLRALGTRTLVLTDRREHEQEWPWPDESLVEWDFEGSAPSRLAEVDLFHLHNGWTATSRGLELIDELPDKRYLASFLGTDVNKHAHLPGNAEKYRRLFEKVDAVVALAEFLAAKLIDLGCPESKIVVIPPGVEPSILPRKSPADFSPAGTLRVCMLARMIELKGIDVAIEATDLAAQEARVSLDVVGDGPERDRIHELASEVNSRHGGEIVRIHSDGAAMAPHRDAMDVLKGSDCLVNCSRRLPDGSEETMSVAMIEAQMVGVPVIAFWCGGAAEIVRQDETGWLARFPEDEAVAGYDEASPQGLATALVRLAVDREARIRMGCAAAERARSLFSTSVVAGALDRLYRELVDAD